MLLAKKIIDIVDIPGYSKYSNSAFLKIENLVCDNFKKDFEDIQKRIVFDIKLNDKEIDNPYIFDTVKKALKDNLKMKITYMEDNSITVKLKVKKGSYPEIKDQVFFKYGHVEEKEDCFIVYVKTPNPGFYVSVAFRFFNCMELLEPAWLREKFKEELNNLNDAYML